MIEVGRSQKTKIIFQSLFIIVESVVEVDAIIVCTVLFQPASTLVQKAQVDVGELSGTQDVVSDGQISKAVGTKPTGNNLSNTVLFHPAKVLIHDGLILRRIFSKIRLL